MSTECWVIFVYYSNENVAIGFCCCGSNGKCLISKASKQKKKKKSIAFARPLIWSVHVIGSPHFYLFHSLMSQFECLNTGLFCRIMLCTLNVYDILSTYTQYMIAFTFHFKPCVRTFWFDGLKTTIRHFSLFYSASAITPISWQHWYSCLSPLIQVHSTIE